MRETSLADDHMETVRHTRFLDPTAVIAAAGIRRGDEVADFGCAGGYFTIPCATVTGDDGTVYAIDILPAALEAVEGQARVAGCRNVVTRRANLERACGSGLDDGSVRWVILKNVLFMSGHRDALLREAFRVLSIDGQALVVEWNDRELGMGPAMEQRISRQEVQALAEAAGFVRSTEVPAGDYHYALLLSKH